jgi:hypothetical protein
MSNQIYRHEGFKILINNSNGYVQNNISGSWLDTPFSSNVYTTAEYWFCYTLRNTQNIVDAFGSNFDKVQSVSAQNWYYEKPVNPVVYSSTTYSTNDPTDKYLEYGKMYIVTFNQNISGFAFQSNNNVPVFGQLSAPQYFSYNDMADYEVIDVAGVDSLENVSEIGVFQGETCVGAASVSEFPVQILTYSDAGNTENQELSFRVISDAKGENKISYISYNQAGTIDNKPLKARKNKVSSVKLTASQVNHIVPVSRIELGQNYPNPFNPSTTIAFKMPQAGRVELKIFNVKGQLVKTLLSGEMKAGAHSVNWDGKDSQGKSSASGIYFCRLSAGKDVQSRKMLLIK